MHFFELDKIVRDNTDDFRLYNWREIERMREDLASISLYASSLSLYVKQDDDLVKRLLELRLDLRREKQYNVSDKIRNILTQSGYEVKDA